MTAVSKDTEIDRTHNEPEGLFPTIDFGVTAEQLTELCEQYAGLTEITDRASMDAVKKALRVLVTMRTELDDKRLAMTEPARKFQKEANETGKALIAILAPAEARLGALKDAVEAEKKREREARAVQEQARIARIHALVDEMRKLPHEFRRASSDNVEIAMETLKAQTFEADVYGEFAELAAETRVDVLGQLTELWEGARHDENLAEQQAKESARLAEEKEALAKERKELEAAQKAERDKQAAAEKKAADAKAKKEAAARAKRLAPDREQIIAFVEAIESIELPTLKDAEAILIVARAADALGEIVASIRADVEQM